VAQSWRSGRTAGQARPAHPLDAAALERIGLRYVERYATTRAKLRAYLQRKLRERGWAGEGEPQAEALVERFADLGYVDDAAFAVARAAGLVQRGYGPRRVAASLRAAGIGESDAEPAEEAARDEAWQAALTFARRKRIGPFAGVAADRPAREKALAAMLRAGHGFAVARRIVDAPPGAVPEPDDG
jgi:regulatory protein